MEEERGPTVFVTVGSTKFHALVKAILSRPVLDAISKGAKEAGRGNATVIIQFGSTAIQEILFDDEDGLHSLKRLNAGTLPIKVIGQNTSGPGDDKGKVIDNFSPESIKRQLSDGAMEADDQNPGLKHFTMDWKAHYGLVHLELIEYVSSISNYLAKAAIVVSHAGSGTILEALRLDEAIRPKLVVVPNETLMDNHQKELAQALSERHYVYAARLKPQTNGVSSMVGKLPDLLHLLLCGTENTRGLDTLQPFPSFVPGRFRAIVDEEMGY